LRYQREKIMQRNSRGALQAPGKEKAGLKIVSLLQGPAYSSLSLILILYLLERQSCE